MGGEVGWAHPPPVSLFSAFINIKLRCRLAVLHPIYACCPVHRVAALGVAEDPPEVGLVQGHAGEGCMPREWDVGRTGGLMGLKLTLRRRKTH